MERQRILVLYSRLNGFVLSTLKAALRTGACDQIDVVYWADAKATGNRYEPENIDGITLHQRAGFDDAGLRNLILGFKPTTIYLPGWMDKGYLSAVSHLRREGQTFTTVAGIDDQWRGGFRQRLGSLWFRVAYKRLFDIMWVAGPAQYHYARQFGYDHDRIVGNLLSADTGLIKAGDATARRFVFVGRFDPVKGLETLLNAHAALPEKVQAEWPLVLIGDGPLRARIEAVRTPHVQIVDYLQPEGVAAELERGGVGILASRWEQWGVSLHEMAAAGLPLIASVQAGASSTFVIPGFNGFLVRGGDVGSMCQAMLRMVDLPASARVQMGRESRSLAACRSPEIAAASLLSARILAQT